MQVVYPFRGWQSSATEATSRTKPSEQTHPGEKRLVRLCRERCPLLPERFEENLERLFADLFAGNGRVEEDVRAILGALEKILVPIFETRRPPRS